MRKVKIAALILALIIAACVGIKFIVNATRPLVETPVGTAYLDNKIDTNSVSHLLVDGAGVLSEETKQSVLIYNANWQALENRVLAVVTVENTTSAETDAWQWFEQLSLGENDALLLLEAGGNRECVLVAKGKYEQDLATLHYGYMERMTYMPMRNGEFDTAVLEVFGQLHYFFGYDEEAYWRYEMRVGTIAVSIFAVVNIPILLHFISEQVDKRRFRKWYKDYATDPQLKHWRSVFFWHRTGSRWYKTRMSGTWVDYDDTLRTERKSRNQNYRVRTNMYRR